MSDPDRHGPSPDPPDERALREELVRFARRILHLEEEGRLLDSPADLQVVIGELRRRLFEWEVRRATELRDARSREGATDPDRVVREAQARDQALRDELGGESTDEPDGPDEGGAR